MTKPTENLLSVQKWRDPSLDDTYAENVCNNVGVFNLKEVWRIHLETMNAASNSAHELSQITITMPGNLKWQGNIQDLMAMHKFLDNAVNDIGPDACYAETISELKQMRSHFTKD